MGETSMISGSGTQSVPSGDHEVKGQTQPAGEPVTTEHRVEARGLFVRVKSGAESVALRVDTRLLTEQERIERANEAIRRKRLGS
jgi:hypothetical protein